MVQASRSDPDDNSSSPRRPQGLRPAATAKVWVPQTYLTMLMAAKLNGAALRVGLAIMQRQFEWKKDDARAQPITLGELVALTRLSRRAVIDAVKDLKAAGLLHVEPGRGRNHCSWYALMDPEKVNNGAPLPEEDADQPEPDGAPIEGEKVHEPDGKGAQPPFSEAPPILNEEETK